MVVREHGARVDAPHIAAYSTADSLLALYPSWAADPTATAAVRAKTFYAGAFSRFDDRPVPDETRAIDEVLVMAGTGGTCLDAQWLGRLAEEVGGR